MKRGSGFARWMKYHPATQAATHSPTAPVKREALKVECPQPQRMGQDQYRCHACGLVWGVDEDKPPCQSTDASAT